MSIVSIIGACIRGVSKSTRFGARDEPDWEKM